MGEVLFFYNVLSLQSLDFQTRPDGAQVTLHIYDGAFDHAMASLVARWHGEGKDIGLDGLIVLTYLKDHRFISTAD
ncbi:MAG: hypothetical protein V1862_04525, partial [Methanobacteriota archaeon]